MPLSQSCSIALFCMAVVFGVLFLLWGILKLCSFAVQAAEKSKKQRPDNRSR